MQSDPESLGEVNLGGPQLLQGAGLMLSLVEGLNVVLTSPTDIIIAQALLTKAKNKLEAMLTEIDEKKLEFVQLEDYPEAGLSIIEIRRLFADYCQSLGLKNIPNVYNLLYYSYIPKEWKRKDIHDSDLILNAEGAIKYIDFVINYVRTMKSLPQDSTKFSYNSNWENVFTDKLHAYKVLEDFKQVLLLHFSSKSEQ